MKINKLLPDYLKHLKTLGRSYYTIRKVKYGLGTFNEFLKGENIHDIEDLTHDEISEYQQDLAFRFTSKGKLLSLRTQESLLCTVKGFTRFLKDKDYLVSDPGEKIKPPKQPKSLPRVILSLSEVKKIMQAPDMRTNLGYRDRVVLEILYDTAIRRLEVKNLMITDLDLNSGYILIREGKGNKDRVVPLSKRVCELITNYIIAVRPELLQEEDRKGYLILNQYGEPINPNGIWRIVKRCAQASGIKKNVTPHTLRHTCATHMLRNGAPLRHIQEMLGHESLETTQLYTHVTINDLKEIHAKYHPGENPKD